MRKKIFDHFKKADPKLFLIIEKLYKIYGDELFAYPKQENLFSELVESIVSQQLSVKSSDAIFNRLIGLMPKKKLTPENLLKISDVNLREAGLSFGKIKYLRDLSEKIIKGDLDLKELDKLDNEEIIQKLTQVKGIGRWTAEMFLMSALGRPDVFSHGDLGLKNAFKKIYGVKEYKIETAEEIVVKWSPYRTIASRILWRSLTLPD